ncbi:sodium-coupled neutral amino acid transporter 9 [Pelomyxa schiedti]|nr:sodium-coupled neutral amino acid transporter 9 [Pelomyxa schiedti]
MSSINATDVDYVVNDNSEYYEDPDSDAARSKPPPPPSPQTRLTTNRQDYEAGTSPGVYSDDTSSSSSTDADNVKTPLFSDTHGAREYASTSSSPPEIKKEAGGYGNIINDEEALVKDQPKKYQSSFLTIFSVWNTMMGTALLSMPWGFSQSGIWGGLLVVVVMGSCTLYTAMLVMNVGKGSIDFIDVCEQYLGLPGKIVAWAGSIMVLFGACVIYFILMSTNLNTLVIGIVTSITGEFDPAKYWGKYSVPFYVFVCMLPCLLLKQWSVFVKINSIGIVWVLYVITFMIISSGLNWQPDPHYTPIAERALYLAGILSLSFFVHNFVLNVATKANPAHARRDVAIGFCLGGLSYTIVGLVGYLAFGDIIAGYQDFLDYFPATDIYGMTARAAVVLQMASIFPLVSALMRGQIFRFVMKREWPGILLVVAYSFVVLAAGYLLAVFYPQVGDVLRYTGAVCGFFYLFLLPVSVYLMREWKEKRFKKWSAALHSLLIILGLFVIISQFVF